MCSCYRVLNVYVYIYVSPGGEADDSRFVLQYKGPVGNTQTFIENVEENRPWAVWRSVGRTLE